MTSPGTDLGLSRCEAFDKPPEILHRLCLLLLTNITSYGIQSVIKPHTFSSLLARSVLKGEWRSQDGVVTPKIVSVRLDTERKQES
jgi:hypothetical protein